MEMKEHYEAMADGDEFDGNAGFEVRKDFGDCGWNGRRNLSTQHFTLVNLLWITNTQINC